MSQQQPVDSSETDVQNVAESDQKDRTFHLAACDECDNDTPHLVMMRGDQRFTRVTIVSKCLGLSVVGVLRAVGDVTDEEVNLLDQMVLDSDLPIRSKLDRRAAEDLCKEVDDFRQLKAEADELRMEVDGLRRAGCFGDNEFLKMLQLQVDKAVEAARAAGMMGNPRVERLLASIMEPLTDEEWRQKLAVDPKVVVAEDGLRGILGQNPSTQQRRNPLYRIFDYFD